MTSRIVIKNADLITLNPDGDIHYQTDLWLEDGKIAHIGAQEGHADETIDGTGRVVLPAFFNAHCHAAMTFERGWAEDLPFPRWLNEKIWVAESALTPEDVFWGTQLALCEMIKSGTAGFNDHYFFMHQVAEAVLASGMKALLTNCVFGIGADKEIGDGLEDALDLIQSYHQKGDGRLRTCLGPHSPYICPPEFLRELVGLARNLNVPLHLHLAETQEQQDTSRQKYGKSAVQHVADLGVFEVGCIAAHCLALSDEDIRLLAQNGVRVARTPLTYMKLAMPILRRTAELQAQGVTVALGTDGAGSNHDMDMFAVVRQTALLEKYLAVDPEIMAGDLPLRMATQVGAETLGFTGSGVLAVGAPADLIVVEMTVPHHRPRHNLIANLVHGAKGADVTHTLVDGRVLMRERHLLTLDEAEILRQAEARAFKLVGSEMRQVRAYHH
jgi:5-methylthioadenosine/S-adenosylhomocysteine deaminase